MRYKFVLDKAAVLGKDIKSANATQSTTSVDWQTNLNFNSAGGAAFGKVTEQMFNKYGVNSVQDELAVVLDGNVISFPVIQGAIPGGSAQITGSFSQDEATNLANVLNYGALPLTFTKESVQSISPSLGSDQLRAGLIAGAIGLLLVVLYCLLYYRGLAVVAVSSLIIAGVLVFEAIVLLGKYQDFALQLSGVAGLIVAIGITADSFVVFFERLRDEVRDGRTLRTAVERGWKRARRTVLVSDTVSFLAAALLWYFSLGEVKGFAFTLGLTTIIDVVVVFLFTKPMVTLLARTKFFGQGHPLSGLDPARLGRADTVAIHQDDPGARGRPDEGGMMSLLGNFGSRLYRGEVSFDFVGRQKLWYIDLRGDPPAQPGRPLRPRAELQRGLQGRLGHHRSRPPRRTSIVQVQNAVASTGDGEGAIVQHVGSGQQRHLAGADGQAELHPGPAGPVHPVPGPERPAEQDQRELRGGQLGLPDLAEGPAGADRLPHRDRHLPVDRVRVADGGGRPDRAGARHRDHRGHLRAGRVPGQPRPP